MLFAHDFQSLLLNWPFFKMFTVSGENTVKVFEWFFVKTTGVTKTKT